MGGKAVTWSKKWEKCEWSGQFREREIDGDITVRGGGTRARDEEVQPGEEERMPEVGIKEGGKNVKKESRSHTGLITRK